MIQFRLAQMARAGAACLLLAGLAAKAADTTSSPAQNAGGLSASRMQRAQWQQRLTLGPGDVVSITLFGHPESKTDVLVGPDGSLGYLQAANLKVTGMTIDELRSKLNSSLERYYQNPRVIVSPGTMRSKKFFVLGAVVNKGVFNLDRPMTLIEAIARAGGLETGVYEQKTVELADLQHSFLIRNGQRMPVDFERLFQHGDLTQNIPLEPDDYLYFAAADGNQIYVLGEVSQPGVVTFAPKPSVVRVITARGGFTDKAFKSRVLVVRGSLSHPETFVIDPMAIVRGQAKDFPLEPRDIVYVSSNPWLKAEDILDTAARAFLQGMFVQYTTLKVGPLITSPILK